MFNPKRQWSILAGVAALSPVVHAHPGHDHTPIIMSAAGLALLVLLIAGPLFNSLLGLKKRSAPRKPVLKKAVCRSRQD